MVLMTKLLSGTELVGYIEERQARQVRALRQASRIFPRLVIIKSTNASPVIDVYVRMKPAHMPIQPFKAVENLELLEAMVPTIAEAMVIIMSRTVTSEPMTDLRLPMRPRSPKSGKTLIGGHSRAEHLCA